MILTLWEILTKFLICQVIKCCVYVRILILWEILTEFLIYKVIKCWICKVIKCCVCVRSHTFMTSQTCKVTECCIWSVYVTIIIIIIIIIITHVGYKIAVGFYNWKLKILVTVISRRYNSFNHVSEFLNKLNVCVIENYWCCSV